MTGSMIAPMIGHDAQQSAFLSALAGGRLPHAWLLAGAKGLGKAGFARAAAAFLLADGDRRAATGATSLALSPDEPAMRLVDAGAHPEFLWLKREPPKSRKVDGPASESDLARNITVDQVRDLLARMRTRPALSRHRAVVIDSIDDMERGAANALLKTLEEPPEGTVFFLVSHNPGGLLPTIRSRCRLLRFGPLDDAALAALLQRERPDLDTAVVTALLGVAGGSPGRALELADGGAGEVAGLLESIAQTGDPDNRLRSDLAKKLGAASEKQRFATMLAQAAALAARIARDDPARRIAALDARARLLSLGRGAIAGSEDAATVSFVVASTLAGLGKRVTGGYSAGP